MMNPHPCPLYRQVISWLIDVIFVAAIAINFNTLIVGEKGHDHITNRRVIANNYLRGWFTIDFICAVPWTSFADSSSILGMAPALRLLRVIKMLRMNKVTLTLTLTFHPNPNPNPHLNRRCSG